MTAQAEVLKVAAFATHAQGFTESGVVRLRWSATVALVVLFCALSNLASAQALKNAFPAATPLQIQPPKFPDGAPAELSEVQVDINGVLGADGVIHADATVVAPAGLEAYADAVKAVLSQWRYAPEVDQGACETVDSVIATSAWFDVKRKRFFVGQPAPREPDKDDKLPVRIVFQRQPVYTVAQLDYDGRLEILYKVDRDAVVEKVSLRYSRPSKIFDSAALKAGRSMKLEWREGVEHTPFCASQEYLFCQNQSGNSWLTECDRTAPKR